MEIGLFVVFNPQPASLQPSCLEAPTSAQTLRVSVGGGSLKPRAFLPQGFSHRRGRGEPHYFRGPVMPTPGSALPLSSPVVKEGR